MGWPVNWISWPAPSTTVRDAPMRSARTSQLASKPGVVAARDDELGEAGRGKRGERQVHLVERTTTAEHRHERDRRGQHVGRELVGIAAHGREEPHDPLRVGEVRVPEVADLFDQRAGGRVVLDERERRRLEQRERQRRLGTAGRGEHGAEAAVRVADEMGAGAHQLGDVVGVGEEVLADGRRAAPVAAPVGYEEAEALFGQRPLRVPLLGAGGQ